MSEFEDEKTIEHPSISTRPTRETPAEEIARILEWSEGVREETTQLIPVVSRTLTMPMLPRGL